MCRDHQSVPVDRHYPNADRHSNIDDDGTGRLRRPGPRARRDHPVECARRADQARDRRGAALTRGGARALRGAVRQLDRRRRGRTAAELAAISLGQAKAQALQAAASAARDTQLLKSRVANGGSVVAITRGRGPAAGEWVLVTREQTTGQDDYAGLPPTLHVIYAQLTDTRTDGS